MSSSSVLPFVRGVDFSRNDLKDGGLTGKAVEMSNLRWVRLNRAQLPEVPADVEKYLKLEILSLTHNSLKEVHGIAPPSFPALKVLNVRDNNLKDSSVPSDLFRLAELVTLDLSHNDLTKVPDELKEAKDLIVLNLSHNKITSIPGSMFVHLSGLQYFDVSSNSIHSLPPQIRRLEHHLTTLNLANNPLNHYVFKVLDKLTNLTYLNLSNCGRDLNNTPHLDKLVNLTDIDMSHNGLSRIPEQVYLLEKLRRVNFSHNSVRELSSLIDTWTDLVTLDMTANLLTALHPHLCKCVMLKRLFLSDNKLTFEGIPPGIGKLGKLEHFIAARNKLQCIPEGLCRCYSLRRLILTSNSLLTLPEAIHIMKLEKLDLTDNPDLVMPPKPQTELKGTGAEFYNINFDPSILRTGAVVTTSTAVKTSYSRQKERYMKMMKHRRTSVTNRSDESAAKKVLQGLVDIADHKSDVMSAGAGIELQEEQAAPRKPKRWDESLVRPDLDYGNLFIDDTGNLPGITVWQIENFYPCVVDEAFNGRFYTADSYIILKTFFNDASELDWNIYYWIGNDSTVDKKACAAMHAVHLRNMLSCKGRSHREEQGEESEEFEEMFDNGISHIEGGTASGFFAVEDVEYALRMYRVQAKKGLHLDSVALDAKSLDHSHVFILDDGLKIFVWCGAKSRLNDRSKGRLVADRINKLERKNKAQLMLFRAGDEPDEFWNVFGGYPKEPIKLVPDRPLPPPSRPLLYRAGMGQGYLELPQVEWPNGKLSKTLLKSKDVYIFDCHSDIFVWIGQRSARLVRAAALKLADELLEMMRRPSSVAIVTRVLEGVEPMAFRLHFSDWHEVLSVDFTTSSVEMEKRRKQGQASAGIFAVSPEKKAPKVDLSALFQPRQPTMSKSQAIEIMNGHNSLLRSMQCCVIEHRKFSILSKEEKGHFYSGECYFFLCHYIVPKEADSSDSEKEESDEDEEDHQTVVYFWQGLSASHMGWLQFTHGILNQLEKAVGDIEVIRLKQQQEDYRFLSHFGGKFIIHQGKRNGVDNSKPSLYQMRANFSNICRRIVQVPATPKSLNSNFCFILKVPFENTPGAGIVYVWIGNKTTQEESIHAEQLGRSMFESTYSNQLLSEGHEPENFFWVALGGKDTSYETDALYLRRSRLFRCSNDKGYFSISERFLDFCQGDLSDEDVMLMDSGRELFIWFGKNASEMEKRLAMKSAQVYIKHKEEQQVLEEDEENDEKDGEQVPPPKHKLKVAMRSKEPRDFTRCFHGWVDRSKS